MDKTRLTRGLIAGAVLAAIGAVIVAAVPSSHAPPARFGATVGGGGIVKSVRAGTNVTVDSTDPYNPKVSSSGGGGGAVTNVSGTAPIVCSPTTGAVVCSANAATSSLPGTQSAADKAKLDQIGATRITNAIQRCTTFLGLTPTTIAVADQSEFMDPFAVTNAQQWSIGGGTPVNTQNRPGGILTMAIAGTTTLFRPDIWSEATESGGVKKWCYVARIQIGSGTVPSGSIGTSGMVNHTGSLGYYVGAYGTSFSPSDATKFNFSTYNGTTQDYAASTVAVDAAWHDVLIGCNATGCSGQVDAEALIRMDLGGHAPVTGTKISPYFQSTAPGTNNAWDFFVVVVGAE